MLNHQLSPYSATDVLTLLRYIYEIVLPGSQQRIEHSQESIRRSIGRQLATQQRKDDPGRLSSVS
ncbi:MAG TPA: hypothetical protein VH458_22715 [Vicinamibacterales bacterium]|jgi:hypothetical protein